MIEFGQEEAQGEELVEYFNRLPAYKYDGVRIAHGPKLSGFIINPKFTDYINHENFGCIEYMKNGRFYIVMTPIKKDDKYFLITGDEIDMDNKSEHKKLFKLFETNDYY